MDLSGRRSSGLPPLRSDRSALLEQSRKERQQRLQQKEQQAAVVRLQAFIRGRQAVSRLRQQQRSAFDSDIQRTLAGFGSHYRQPTAASPSPLPDLLLCIRRFLFFHSRRCADDRSRWQLLVQALTLSLRSAQPQPLPARPGLSSSAHYGLLPLLPGSEWRQVWIHQVRRLTALLLSDVACDGPAASSASGSGLTAAAFLLYQLFSAPQWSIAHGSKSAAAAIASCQLAALQSVVLVSGPAAASLRPALPAACPSWHAALRSRILRMADLSAATVSTADRNTLGLLSLLTVMPLQLPAAASAALPQPFAASFVCHILSIPLLSARLTAAGLTAVLASVIEPGIVMAALQLMASESSATQSPLSAALSSLPGVPSCSPWEAQQASAVPAASAAAGQLALESEDEDDGSEAGRGRDSDSEEEMEDAAPAPASTAAASPHPRSLWLLGNLLDWQSQLLADRAAGDADSRQQQRSRAAALLAVMQELLLITPSRHFPSAAGQSAAVTAHSGSAAAALSLPLTAAPFCFLLSLSVSVQPLLLLCCGVSSASPGAALSSTA